MEGPLTIGNVYRLASQHVGGFNYPAAYREGWFIHVRILSGPDSKGDYEATTRGEDGKHLGPGGGWSGPAELKTIRPGQLEEIPSEGGDPL
jgi:hypothetical protein